MRCSLWWAVVELTNRLAAAARSPAVSAGILRDCAISPSTIRSHGSSRFWLSLWMESALRRWSRLIPFATMRPQRLS